MTVVKGSWRCKSRLSPVTGLRTTLKLLLTSFYRVQVSRKTLSPHWITERDMYISPSSLLSIFVFDARRFKAGQWHGFLGTTVIQASSFLDNSSLGEGATKVLNFRLRKRVPTDVVTGTVCVKVGLGGKLVWDESLDCGSRRKS